MKIARFEHKGVEKLGLVSVNKITPLSCDSIEACMDETSAGLKSKCLKEEFGISSVRILPPVRPSKIICLGWNYLEHVEELKNKVPEKPMVFFKPSSAVIGHLDEVVLPKTSISSEVNNEVELAVIIGRKARNVSRDSALEYVLGYTIMQDITARDIQFKLRQKNEQWEISKAFDTFAPLGPWITTKHGIKNPHKLRISLKVNGKIRQDSNTAYMIFKIPEVIEYLSSVMTLLPGDVISTGTPKGVDLIRPGDILEAEIEGIGVLKNKVISSRG